MKNRTRSRAVQAVFCVISAGIAFDATCGPLQPALSFAQKEKPVLLETLRELTAIESGSREPAKLDINRIRSDATKRPQNALGSAAVYT